MAQTVSPRTDRQWLAERQLFVGSRVGSCIAKRHPYGTVIAVASLDDLTVRWDNGTVESVRWSAISPFGYLDEYVEDGLEPDPAEQLVTIGREGWWTRNDDDVELIAA